MIVPVYNAEKTLAACVQSILNQTYTDYELILIDDGSKDDSGQLCNELQELCRSKSVRCRVIHQENGGVSRARNCGMKNAAGQYFVCVDSDDVIEPCYLEDLVQTAEEHPELGYVICGFRCTSHVHDYILTDREPLTVVNRRDYMRLYDKILIQSPCLALYRTEVVQAHGIEMREDMSLAEDILFNLAYLDAVGEVSIGVINKTNYVYQDEDQYSLYRRFRPDHLTINTTVNQALEECLKRWDITDEASWQKYYNTVFYNYQTVLKNTFHRQNPMSAREKIAYNTAVMKREDFQEALRKCTFSGPPALKRAYESGNYKKVLAAERIQKAKCAIAGVFKG